MKIRSLILLSSSLLLTACNGSFDDEFFQMEGSLKGVVCFDGIYASAGSGKAKEIVERVFQYYGSNANVSLVTSVRGLGANCKDYKNKADPELILSADFYNNTIVPNTKY